MQARLEDGKIRIKTNAADRFRFRAIPGSRWDPAAKEWTLPASVGFYNRLMAEAEESDEIDCEELQWLARMRKKAETDLNTGFLRGDCHGFRYKQRPWEHQYFATAFAYNSDAAMLHMHMGTGKTKVVLDTIAARRHQLVLILCPKAVIRVWNKEVEKHAAVPMVMSRVSTTAAKRTVAQKASQINYEISYAGQPLLVVLNYEAAWHEPLASLILKLDWDCVVFDESSKIKAPGGRASRFCARIPARHRLALTGTPMPHSPLDIYAQYRAVDPGIFGSSFIKFRAQYGVMGGYQGKVVVDFQNQDDMRRRIDEIRFEVRDDALDLPPIQTVDVPVSLGTKAVRHYGELSEEFITGVHEGTVTASNALVRLLRLQQVTSGYLPVEDEDTGEVTLVELGHEKADALQELLESASNEPVVVFCRFRHDLDIIRKIAESLDRTFGEISGRTNDLDDWDLGEIDVLGVQIQAGGMGIDLTRARYSIYFSLGFSLGDYQQSVARIHRPGQTKPVTIYHLVAVGTVDQSIIASLEKKRDVIREILEEARNAEPGDIA